MSLSRAHGTTSASRRRLYTDGRHLARSPSRGAHGAGGSSSSTTRWLISNQGGSRSSTSGSREASNRTTCDARRNIYLTNIPDPELSETSAQASTSRGRTSIPSGTKRGGTATPSCGCLEGQAVPFRLRSPRLAIQETRCRARGLRQGRQVTGGGAGRGRARRHSSFRLQMEWQAKICRQTSL